MWQNDGRSGPRMLKNVMRAGDAFENPTLTLKAAFNVAAIGQHFPSEEA
jgi:hypothetical protein